MPNLGSITAVTKVKPSAIPSNLIPRLKLLRERFDEMPEMKIKRQAKGG
jgi:hypothetical protein